MHSLTLLCAYSQNDLILLTSFAAQEDQYGMDNRPRRFYAVVRMARGEESFEVKSVRTVPYQTVRASSLMFNEVNSLK